MNKNNTQFTDLSKIKLLLSVKDVAALFGIGERTVWRMAGNGTLPPPIKIGNKISRWRLADLEKWVQTRKSA